jgi:rhodanese-related sulfurtransferase
MLAGAVVAIGLVVGACGSGSTGASAVDGEAGPTTEARDETGSVAGGVDAADGEGDGAASSPDVRVVSPADGAAILADPPADLVVLDVRTAEEFDQGHLPGATMLDFYAPDFADRLAELDPDRTYLVYCRSGNRSGQTRAMMERLGFGDVADVDGGIVAWAGAELPIEP